MDGGSSFSTGADPVDVFDPETYRNWCRNKQLIDFSSIPDDIVSTIKTEYKNQQNKGREKLFNYFVKNKLKNLSSSIGDF